MVHALTLIATGVLVPLLAFLTWRRGALQGGTATLLGLMSCLWWSEVLLTVHDVARWVPPAESPGHPATGVLPWVAGHTVTQDHGVAPPRDRTIAFVGDSFTYGQGVVAEDAFPRRVAGQLAEEGIDAHVVVHAAPSRSLWDEAVLYPAVTATLDPDVVVWVAFLNDFGWPGQFEGTDLVTEFHEPEPTGIRMVDHARSAIWRTSVTPQSLSLYRDSVAPERAEWIEAQERLQAIAAETTSRGGRFLLVLFPVLHELEDYPLRSVHETLGAFGESAGMEVVDLLPAFEGLHAPSLWVSRRDHHPNEEGHRIAADAIASALKAAPIPNAGPTRCKRLPGFPGIDEELERACEERGSTRSLLALAEALLLLPGRPLPSMAFDAGKVAADLAVVAASTAPSDDAVALAARDVVFRGRAWGSRSHR